MTAAEIAEGLEARRTGCGWIARCPAHEDDTFSFHLSEGRYGKTLVHCFGGCSQRTVIAALRDRGLWTEHHEPRRIVAEFNYTDASGKQLYQIVRCSRKGFRHRYPDGAGAWIWKKHPNQVLYRLDEVLQSQIVFIVQQEEDVETLRAWGFVATTLAGGVSAPWLASFNDALQGRECIIIPTNNNAGWDRAKIIARSLLRTARSIIILDDIRRHGCENITEWCDRGHGETELIALLEGADAV